MSYRFKPFCSLCHLEKKHGKRLLCFRDGDDGPELSETEQDTGYFLCVECVRAVKRIRFSDFGRSAKAPKEIVVPDPYCGEPDADGNIPF